MPKHIAPTQIYLPSGMAEGRLPFVIVTPTDSIQAAIDIVSPAGLFPGKHIWMWPGTWVLLAPLTIPVGAEIYIWGCGRDTIIQASGGVDPMFQLAAGVIEFELRDLFLDGDGWINTVIETQGALTRLQLDHIGVDAASFVGPASAMVDQTGVRGITDVLIDFCECQGGLDLRASGANIRDSFLDALNDGHDFRENATIYSARNNWGGGVGGPGGTVAVGGATALFHDEGSGYGGDNAITMIGGEMNLRGCHLRSSTGATITHTGGSLRLAECIVENSGNQPCINNGAGADYIGVHDCHILATAGGVDWGVVLGGCGGEVVGCRFEDAGFDTSFPCTFAANIMDSVVVQSVIRVQCNNVSITGNNIIACAHAGGIAIELDVNDDCTVTGNQLQNYTVNENAGATGNIITGNRVGA